MGAPDERCGLRRTAFGNRARQGVNNCTDDCNESITAPGHGFDEARPRRVVAEFHVPPAPVGRSAEQRARRSGEVCRPPADAEDDSPCEDERLDAVAAFRSRIGAMHETLARTLTLRASPTLRRSAALIDDAVKEWITEAWDLAGRSR